MASLPSIVTRSGRNHRPKRPPDLKSTPCAVARGLFPTPSFFHHFITPWETVQGLETLPGLGHFSHDLLRGLPSLFSHGQSPPFLPSVVGQPGPTAAQRL